MNKARSNQTKQSNIVQKKSREPQIINKFSVLDSEDIDSDTDINGADNVNDLNVAENSNKIEAHVETKSENMLFVGVATGSPIEQSPNVSTKFSQSSRLSKKQDDGFTEVRRTKFDKRPNDRYSDRSTDRYNDRSTDRHNDRHVDKSESSGLSKFNNDASASNSSLSKFDGGWETATSKRKYKKDSQDGEQKQLYIEQNDFRNSVINGSSTDNTCEGLTSGNTDDSTNAEDKQLYVDLKNTPSDYGNKSFLHSRWTVWVHKADNKEWRESDYTKVYEIDSIGSFWRFFNNFHLFDKTKNQFFIMRNKVKPIWEDNENRKGGICSVKFDCFSKSGRMDIGTEMMTVVSMLVMNETLISGKDEINGISYSIKKQSVLIKLWYKNYTLNIKEKWPASLTIKFDTLLARNSNGMSFGGRKAPNEIEIRTKKIEPEYEEA